LSGPPIRPPGECVDVPFVLVELRGRELVTPTLPGAGRRRDQARPAPNGRVVDVVETAIVVAVVVRIVVISRSGTA
jgi:hypothetical protein